MNTRWHDLIQRYISGNITDAEARVLEQQLKLDPELRDWYLDALNLDSALEAAAESAQAVLSLPMPISQRALMNAAASPAKPWRMFLPSAAAAAALVFCGALLWQVWGRDAKIAELVDVQRARWDGSTLSTEPGSRLGVGRLRLAEGLACLRFARGAGDTGGTCGVGVGWRAGLSPASRFARRACARGGSWILSADPERHAY
jgi:hypothetical protein